MTRKATIMNDESQVDIFLDVAIPVALPHLYTYRPHATTSLHNVPPGTFVRVPFGRGSTVGVVWETKTQAPPNLPLKDITSPLDLPPLPKVQRDFLVWVSTYTLAPLGMVVKLCLSASRAFDDTSKKRRHMSTTRFIIPNENTQSAPPPINLTTHATADVDMCSMAHATTDSSMNNAPSPQTPPLSEEQEQAAQTITSMLTPPRFHVLCLDGVTGSGKTEVYCKGIAKALAMGLQVLVLLPEIGLSQHSFARFEKYFGSEGVDIWHSAMTPVQRGELWRRIAQGITRLVIGARSALFLPYTHLGFIVVDEEHDAAYKQEDGVPYHARDMAIVRAKFGAFPIVLSSATPSLETLINIEKGRYTAVHITQRFGQATLPTIRTIDMRVHKPEKGRFLTEPLIAEITTTLEEGHQAMLFINRRGYAPLTLCAHCGHHLGCPHCTTWLVEHKASGALMCHYCGYTISYPDKCPSCHSTEELLAYGPGIERVTEEAKNLFPAANICELSSETLTSSKKTKKLLSDIEEGCVNIIIGTQIAAKGYNFPHLTFVGIVDADAALFREDPRSCERCFQLLQQVSGRAGRFSDKGHVLVQTFNPEHPAMMALVRSDRDSFVAWDARERKMAHLPPFSHLAALILSSLSYRTVDHCAQRLLETLPQDYNKQNIAVYGPILAPMARLRGRTRLRFLLKCPYPLRLQSFITQWLKNTVIPYNVSLKVDIDPYNFV